MNFKVKDINKSIENLSKEKRDIDFGTLRAIYTEAQSYVPDLQKGFEEMMNFHNLMIQDRIDFIKMQLYTEQELLEQYPKRLSEILKGGGKITIEVLGEGLPDELNILNREIKELSLKKGEIQQPIHLLEGQGQTCQNLNSEPSDIEKQVNNEKVGDKAKTFNQVFSDYYQRLYGEKYLLAYNENWKEEKEFPINIVSLGGKVGIGEKKTVTVAYNLAYMQYSTELGMDVPQLVVHGKMENAHISQLETIFEICEGIKGQYIIPILRERIDKVEQKYIEKAKILGLSSSDEFFGI